MNLPNSDAGDIVVEDSGFVLGPRGGRGRGSRKRARSAGRSPIPDLNLSSGSRGGKGKVCRKHANQVANPVHLGTSARVVLTDAPKAAGCSKDMETDLKGGKIYQSVNIQSLDQCSEPCSSNEHIDPTGKRHLDLRTCLGEIFLQMKPQTETTQGQPEFLIKFLSSSSKTRSIE